MIIQVDILKEIIEVEFSDIVIEVFTNLNTLRIVFIDESYCDAWFSLKLVGRYSLHWERSFIDGTIYRHDNAPHLRWRGIKTFPRHFITALRKVWRRVTCQKNHLLRSGTFSRSYQNK